MPRYFFNVSHGRLDADDEGAEMTDIGDAKIEASKLLAEILRDAPLGLWRDDLQISVADDRGLVLLTIDIVATEAPAVSRWPR